MKKVVFMPYTPAMVNIVETWLQRLSYKGLILVNKKGWKFVFETNQNKKNEYLIYNSIGTNIGWSYDYYAAKKKYGKKSSKLNRRNCSVFEVDISKKDKNFYGYRYSRNRYYKRHYLGLFLISLIFVIISILLYCFGNKYTLTSIISAIIFLYSLSSVLILHFSDY